MKHIVMLDRIRKCREEIEKKQYEIAEILGCSRTQYTMIENGYYQIRPVHLDKLASLYDVSVDYLIGLSNTPDRIDNPKTYDPHTTAIRLLALRMESGAKQQTIAKHLQKKQRTYSDYETGKVKMKIDTLYDLAKFYNVSIDYLMGRTDDRSIR